MVMDSTGRSALHYASEAVLLENNSSAADFVRKYLVRIPKDALLLSPDYRTNSGFILAYVLDRIRSFGPLKPRHQHTFGSLLTAPSFATASVRQIFLLLFLFLLYSRVSSHLRWPRLCPLKSPPSRTLRCLAVNLRPRNSCPSHWMTLCSTYD